MCLGKYTKNETFVFKSLVMQNSKDQKILGLTINNKLTLKVTLRIYVRKPHKK